MEGVLSGTLAWLFNRFDGSVPFSGLLREAHALGYTEPDPREDLSGCARVGVVAPAPGHASLHSRLTDNLIQFRTRRYADNPLVVQGPGAGPEVTAAGVFGDVLAIAQSLGGRF